MTGGNWCVLGLVVFFFNKRKHVTLFRSVNASDFLFVSVVATATAHTALWGCSTWMDIFSCADHKRRWTITQAPVPLVACFPVEAFDIIYHQLCCIRCLTTVTICLWLQVENKVCTYLVGKIEGGVTTDACGDIADEVTEEVAAAASETGVFDIAISGASYFTVKYFCKDLIKKAENYVGVGPEDICADIGLRRSSPVRLDLSNYTDAQLEIVLHAAARWGASHGLPVAVYPDGSLGHCFSDSKSALMTCLPPVKKYNSMVMSSDAGQTYQAQTTSSSSSSSHTAAIAVGTVMGTMLIALCAVCAVLYRRLQQQSMPARVELHENLLPTTSES
eukprot:m.441433 g.441433  ORF g.441433 m.441433 type:complete len:333 (+) comp20282_c2_seq15:280-1278(+)